MKGANSKIFIFKTVESVRDKAKFFAKRLYKSMKGLGTNDNQLIRIVVTRCEVDMEDIKQAFVQDYGDTLEEFIRVKS